MALNPETARELLDAVVVAFALFGGISAYRTGLAAALSQASDASLNETTQAIYASLARAFWEAIPIAILAVIIVVWS